MNQLDLALSACARVLRPVVRLAMGLGLKQPHLQELLNELLLDEAQRSWQSKGVKPNLSQLSITTGINRKAVTARVRMPRDPLAPTALSSAAKTLTVWLEMATDNKALRRLPAWRRPVSARSNFSELRIRRRTLSSTSKAIAQGISTHPPSGRRWAIL